MLLKNSCRLLPNAACTIQFPRRTSSRPVSLASPVLDSASSSSAFYAICPPPHRPHPHPSSSAFIFHLSAASSCSPPPGRPSSSVHLLRALARSHANADQSASCRSTADPAAQAFRCIHCTFLRESSAVSAVLQFLSRARLPDTLFTRQYSVTRRLLRIPRHATSASTAPCSLTSADHLTRGTRRPPDCIRCSSCFPFLCKLPAPSRFSNSADLQLWHPPCPGLQLHRTSRVHLICAESPLTRRVLSAVSFGFLQILRLAAGFTLVWRPTDRLGSLERPLAAIAVASSRHLPPARRRSSSRLKAVFVVFDFFFLSDFCFVVLLIPPGRRSCRSPAAGVSRLD